MYGSAAEAKKEGWFSRRHRTREDRQAAIKANAEAQEPRPKQVYNHETKLWEKVDS